MGCLRSMADVYSPVKRSWLMSRVRARDTRPELVVGDFLRARGFKFRRHVQTLPGTPDIVLPRLKTAVFINGCFWHQHRGCARAAVPKSHRRFWVAKLTRNAERDNEIRKLLRSRGWSVVTLWECRLKNTETRKSCLSRFLRRLNRP